MAMSKPEFARKNVKASKKLVRGRAQSRRTLEDVAPVPGESPSTTWREHVDKTAYARNVKPYTTISGMYDKVETRKAGDVAPSEQGTFLKRGRKRKGSARRALSTSLDYQDTLG